MERILILCAYGKIDYLQVEARCMPKDFLWGRTVGHLKVTLLLLGTAAFIGALSVRHYLKLMQKCGILLIMSLTNTHFCDILIYMSRNAKTEGFYS